jgi:choice-of-anchor C domain-containing protein
MKVSVVFAAATLAAIAIPAQAAELLTNGSFESGPPAPGGFATYGAGNTSITGWTIVAGTVDHISSYWTASDGVRSLDLTGDAPGTISQAFATTSGLTYNIAFDLWANPAGGTYPRIVFANIGGSDISFSSPGGGSLGAPAWVRQAFSFVATGATTTLSFRADPASSAGFYGPALDNISATVTAVPEPATWTMMFLGFGLAGAALRRRRPRALVAA